MDSTQGTPSPHSSANSSQDSLHKQAAKKHGTGLKGSLGRFFSKKEAKMRRGKDGKDPNDQGNYDIIVQLSCQLVGLYIIPAARTRYFTD